MSPCFRFGGAIVCCSRVYRWKGWLFEVPSYSAPHPLRRDGEPYKRVPERFWDMIDRWDHVKDKKRYRVL